MIILNFQSGQRLEETVYSNPDRTYDNCAVYQSLEKPTPGSTVYQSLEEQIPESSVYQNLNSDLEKPSGRTALKNVSPKQSTLPNPSPVLLTNLIQQLQVLDLHQTAKKEETLREHYQTATTHSLKSQHTMFVMKLMLLRDEQFHSKND